MSPYSKKHIRNKRLYWVATHCLQVLGGQVVTRRSCMKLQDSAPCHTSRKTQKLLSDHFRNFNLDIWFPIHLILTPWTIMCGVQKRCTFQNALIIAQNMKFFPPFPKDVKFIYYLHGFIYLVEVVRKKGETLWWEKNMESQLYHNIKYVNIYRRENISRRWGQYHKFRVTLFVGVVLWHINPFLIISSHFDLKLTFCIWFAFYLIYFIRMDFVNLVYKLIDSMWPKEEP